MKYTNKLPGGKGWILPDMKCLPTNAGNSDIQILADSISDIKKLVLRYNPNNDMVSLLDQIYGSLYIRVGRYRDTVLFEHGALRKPTTEDMAAIAGRCRYKGMPMRIVSDIYDPTTNNREKFFIDTYKY